MYEFKKITPLNGFDYSDLNNARQNNYAWSMCELGGYIYVGTGRNIPLTIIKSIVPTAQIPFLITSSNPVDPFAEIWRYKKDGIQGWEKVYKAPNGSGISGFRFMIADRPFNGNPCIYAAAFGQKLQILKSTNGVDWFLVQPNVLPGTSSRAMIVHRKKVYVATMDEFDSNVIPLLYSSRDPEFYNWEVEIDTTAAGFNPLRNPTSAITNMAVFNHKIYVATANDDGVQVWRTNGSEPRMNEWKLLVDKGFGDSSNKYTLSIGQFQEHLYVSATKELPLAWALPMGCDIIRIDKDDNWKLVVGGKPLMPSNPSKGERNESLSGLGSGFNNPFNVYAWQIQEFNHQLLISTFDDSSNMELILSLLLANKTALEGIIGAKKTKIIIGIYESIVWLLNQFKYPIGFDIYVSNDGINFEWITLRGLCNPNNYGGRMLYVDSDHDLYLGTANPFQGCEVFKADSDTCFHGCSIDKLHHGELMNVQDKINENWDLLSETMPIILNHFRKH